jgi:PAS domain S-box-containing protein
VTGQPVPTASGAHLHVLLVEDTPADAELVIAELERSGPALRWRLVEDLVGFERALDDDTFDVVLADYQLKGWSGMDIPPILEARGLDLPMILVTGTIGEEAVVDCLRSGATDCVLKHHLDRLPLAVERALAEARMRREQREAESLIRRLSVAVDQSPASIFITDADGTIEYVNHRFTEITGYSAEEAIGRNPRILGSGETPRGQYEALWSTIKSGGTWRAEVRNRRKNGDLYWDEVTISPMRSEKGEITHFVAIQQDITERRWAEQALREREERFRQITESIRDVFFVVEADFSRTLYLSPAYEAIWGRTVLSAYEDPASFMEGVVMEDRPALIASIQRCQAGSEVEEVEFRVVRPDGDVRWVVGESAGVRDENGGVYRICGAVSDATDRRRAERRMRESEERFRQLAEASFDTIVVTQEGVIREANQGIENVWGYTLDEVVGRPAADLVDEDSAEILRRRLATGEEGRYEVVGVTKDGRHITLEVTSRNHEYEGRPGRISALRDITAVRSLEAQYRQAQKMEAIGRLAGGVAHDFNNLLTVITGYTDLARAALPADHPVANDLGQARQAAMDAAGLTRQLLAFSRRGGVEAQVVVLEEFVSQTHKMLSRVLPEDIRLVLATEGRRNAVLIDSGQLQQAVLNLAVNAKDAMPNGGLLTIETGTAVFDDAYLAGHWAARPGRYAMLSMTDTGTGMSADTQARIFEPFFTTKDPGKGTGLGLASVYGIVKQYGGFVWVYSELGQGTTFKVYLPRIDEEDVEARHEAGGEATTGTETILLVEDQAAVRDAIREVLERSGYTVLEAPLPRVALDFAASHAGPVDLLLTDLVMPEMSGVDLAAAFRTERPDARIVFMSGYSEEALLDRMKEGLRPTDGYIPKPFSADVLTRKLRDILDAT